jgi:DNA repair protein RadC
LKAALALVEIRVLDHVITSDDDALSMVEVGMLARSDGAV